MRASLTVRIDERGHRALRELCQETGATSAEVLRDAIEAYRRQRFHAQLARDFAALGGDPAAAADYDAEFESWERATIADGLDDA